MKVIEYYLRRYNKTATISTHKACMLNSIIEANCINCSLFYANGEGCSQRSILESIV